jgi:hypothetical protein
MSAALALKANAALSVNDAKSLAKKVRVLFIMV